MTMADHTYASASASREQTAHHSPVLGRTYSVTVYAFSMAVLLYAAGFIAGRGVAKTIDHGPASPWPVAALIDVLLVLLFAVQHSVMARPWFKRWLTWLVPASAERSSYVLAASIALTLMLWLWRPIPAAVWHASGPVAGCLLALYGLGWLVTLTSTFLISHFDLFGLRQAFLAARGTDYAPPGFTERLFYRVVRHPLMTGFLIIFWAAPVMTVGHLVLSLAMTAYILTGIAFEERDLASDLGDAYRSYRTRVPALIPGLRLRSGQ
jgi:protein-S-isoprenylcysteine O-methyltransferase Ste14